jgi:hypothetical protein
MAKTSFTEMKETTKDASVEDTALITQEADNSTSITITNDQLHIDGMTGDWSRDDLNLPRIKIVAQTSDLVNEGYPVGAIVLNNEVVLAKKDEPVECIVLNCNKQYQEDIAWGTGDMPKVFNSAEEMRAAGYSTEYGSPNYCQPMAHITMLVKAPKGLDEQDLANFPFEFKGEHWAMVDFCAAKSAFKTTAKFIASYMAFGGGDKKIHGVFWELKSGLKTYLENKWYSPTMRRIGKCSDDLVEFVESVA